MSTSRHNAALSAITESFSKDLIQCGSFQTCVVSALVRGKLGHNDARWGTTLAAYVYGTPLPDAHPDIHYYARLTGYSADEIHQIEGAFEGRLMAPGVRRLPDDSDTVEARIKRVVEVLEAMEVSQTPVFTKTRNRSVRTVA